MAIINDQQYAQARLSKFKDYNINPYPYTYETTCELFTFINDFKNIKENKITDYIHSLTGRITNIRKCSKNLYFYTIQNSGYQLQLIVNRTEYNNEDVNNSGNFDIDNELINRGDVIGAYGFAGKSKTGELSLIVKKIVILAPCLRMLPPISNDQHYSVINRDIREKKRYLDLLIDQNNIQNFIIKQKVCSSFRNFLDSNDFIEVTTPILHKITGGASAKPFTTYHNDTKQTMHMRISPELYLKQLVVGGLNRIYELGPQFRNESADKTHNPEFTSLEFYMAYNDYKKLFTFCENLISSVVLSVNKSHIVKYGDLLLDFSVPFNRINIMDHLIQLGIKIDLSLPNDELVKQLTGICNVHKIELPIPSTANKLLDKIISHFLESKCIQPTFLCDHPKIMSPLSKVHRDNNNLTERFELFVAGMEICNAYTELNDPKDQEERFKLQLQDKQNGDQEAQLIDEIFIDALFHGLPPTIGFGCGIDRFVMLLSNKQNIRDIISFPLTS
ncbi:lysyl-tRNA synthetase [Hokovirus HKV1]|uniref:lysine--tRNA ligase n=1 Tax=Hokovirus HKV1 TaxID=1977638 RepID=A0A1V0SFI4_9VIRU|nr:lysyl-tRNA synthetase [Hokovirus HKV1]